MAKKSADITALVKLSHHPSESVHESAMESIAIMSEPDKNIPDASFENHLY